MSAGTGQRGFTPGPWTHYLDSEGYYAIAHSSEAHEPGDVAHVYVPGAIDPEYDDNNEGLANARLIAAAPMLYEAGQRLLAQLEIAPTWCCKMYDEGHTEDCPQEALRAALAAAEPAGEVPS